MRLALCWLRVEGWSGSRPLGSTRSQRKALIPTISGHESEVSTAAWVPTLPRYALDVAIPPFISALREHIGNEMLWLAGVSAVVFDEAGRILLAQRVDDAQWTVISGVLEPGEEPAVGLAREVLEETGVRVHVEAFSALSVTEPILYGNGDLSQYVDLCFVCRPLDAAEAAAAHVADDESLAVGWFAPDGLPDGLSPSSRDRVAWTLDYLADPSAGPRFAR